jgi:hypothetical protein
MAWLERAEGVFAGKGEGEGTEVVIGVELKWS